MCEYFYKNIKPEYHHHIPNIKFKTNFTNCILSTFQKLAYERTENDDWDIVWSQKQFLNELYEKRLQPHQKINHFRNFYELCRKDLLVRNLKKHKKNLQREGKASQAQNFLFYPQTFILPSQYVIFADEFKRQQQSFDDKKNIWIMKPTGRSQGKGIFLFNKISQVSQWENHSAQNYIVQKYVADPLLIGGKKFDIRIYVLVTSYSPLTIYLYRGGFARFTHSRYDQTKINQSQMHLTNVAIQKNAENYDDNIGGKWYIEELKHYLSSKYTSDRVNNSFYKIQEIVVRTLEAMQKTMASDKNNSFQLYGFDVLFDSKLEPWLIQVNGSPSMTANTQTDHKLKMGLLEDTILTINMQKFLTGNEDQIGGFDLICKGKNNNKSNNIFIQKVSFLGTYNNRKQNLKKLAKSNANRLNNLYGEMEFGHDRKKLGTVANNSMKGNHSKLNKRQMVNNSRKNPRMGRQFIIKQKSRKQTNENQMK